MRPTDEVRTCAPSASSTTPYIPTSSACKAHARPDCLICLQSELSAKAAPEGLLAASHKENVINRLRVGDFTSWPLRTQVSRETRRAIITCLRWVINRLDERPKPDRQRLGPSSLAAPPVNTHATWEEMWRCVEAGESWQDALDRSSEQSGRS
jgi:hypothetical protein